MMRIPCLLSCLFLGLSSGASTSDTSFSSAVKDGGASARQFLMDCRSSTLASGALLLLGPCSARIDHSVLLQDGSQIITDGYPIVIDVAGDLTINGFASVRSFQTGVSHGSDGRDGRDAGFIKIEIHGNAVGSILIQNRGEDGERGATGASGGQGAAGSKGGDGVDHLFDCAGGGKDGGQGGTGETGHKGGKGGKGGNGGEVDVQVSGDSSKLTLLPTVEPGIPGAGGLGGAGGAGGPGGPGGSGSTYCHGGHGGALGLPGDKGPDGDRGDPGIPGHILPQRPSGAGTRQQ